MLNWIGIITAELGVYILEMFWGSIEIVNGSGDRLTTEKAAIPIEKGIAEATSKQSKIIVTADVFFFIPHPKSSVLRAIYSSP